MLDGSADGGDPDAAFTQAGIDRTSGSDTWFSLLNSDPVGKLNLDVEGTIVGDGSGLTEVDADTLDGTDGSAFATEAELASGIREVHWDSLTALPADIADGDDDTVPLLPGTEWGLHKITVLDDTGCDSNTSIAIGSQP